MILYNNNLQPELLYVFRNVTSYSCSLKREKVGGDTQFSVLYDKIDSFSVGNSYYKFVEPVDVNYLPFTGNWKCSIYGLPTYSGTADTRENSFDNLKIEIHSDFQKLIRMRPFEMTADEQRRWSELCNVIDLLHYNNTTPIVLKDIGEVRYEMRSRPYKINWINGRSYIIDIARAPGELMSCKSGQWIEAIVKKEPITNKIIEIEAINKISFHIPTKSEVEKYWASLDKSEADSAQFSW